MRGLLQRWTKSSIILISKEESVWRNKRPKSRTVSFAAGRLLTWSTITSGVTGIHRSVENYADLFTISLRNDDIQEFDSKWDGIFIISDENPIWRHLGRIVQIKNTRVWETRDRIRIVWPGDSSEEVGTWSSQIENYGEKKYRVRYSKKELILGPEMENLRRTPWSIIREQNSVYKEFLEIVGNGKPTGNVWKETIAVSATISISLEKLHHQICLRILSCSKMSENHREPEVPEEKVPVVECLDGLARITSKEVAITHFVKSGTLQNACSTRPRVVVDLGKSAHTHIVRLMNNLVKGPKRMMTKSAVAMVKKGDWHERGPVNDQGHQDQGNLVRKVTTS